METNTYMISEARREEVEKLVQKYQQKAARYGALMEAEYGKPYATEVGVYEQGYDPGNHCYISERKGTVKVEVFDLTISSDIIRNGNYNVVAKLEHLDNGNIVTTYGVEVKEAWRHVDCKCDHCKVNRTRNLTFIVRDADGNDKQIGSTCLKDYSGIDPQAIGIWNQLRDICYDMEADARAFDESLGRNRVAYDTIDILALAISIVKARGYVKSEMPGSNRSEIFTNAGKWRPTEAERLEAEAMAKAILEADKDELEQFTVLPNVRVMLEVEYCKPSHFGYLAYAPMAFQDYQRKLEAKRQREAETEAARKSSEYVGEIGKRITIDVKEAKLIASWEKCFGRYGYYTTMTHLYRFIDVNGNVYVWFASNMIDETEVKSIKGTVKDHSERDGVKQTVLTRCKVA